MQFIDLCDVLRFHERPAGVIERIGGLVDIPPEADLAIRAARLLAETFEVGEASPSRSTSGFPCRADLAAAARTRRPCCVALNALWSLGLSEDDLAESGSQVGRRCPIFRPWRGGLGRRCRGTPDRDGRTLKAIYLVVKPDAEVSTVDDLSGR